MGNSIINKVTMMDTVFDSERDHLSAQDYPVISEVQIIPAKLKGGRIEPPPAWSLGSLGSLSLGPKNLSIKRG
jgi:hypothetical protein